MTAIKTLANSAALTLVGAVHALALRIRKNPIESQIVFVLLLIFIGWLQISDDRFEGSDGRIVLKGDELAISALEEIYASFNFTIEGVRSGDLAVPRLVVADVPSGLQSMRVIDRRKRVFFRMVLPMVLMVNETINEDRNVLETMTDKLRANNFEQNTLNEDETEWLNGLAVRYGIDLEDEDVTLEEFVSVLALRVAPIPPSLALAQAVEESAWGTSRFAREGNALFGQWVWNEEDGIIPEQQRDGQEYAVRAFNSPLQSVVGYARNLNTHWAYTAFREKRAAMLEAGGPLDGWSLAETLTQYSERREEYVKSLHAIMRVNKLRPLDTAKLATPEAMVQLAEAG